MRGLRCRLGSGFGCRLGSGLWSRLWARLGWSGRSKANSILALKSIGTLKVLTGIFLTRTLFTFTIVLASVGSLFGALVGNTLTFFAGLTVATVLTSAGV